MEISITGRHVALPETFKQHATEKLSKLDRYSLQIESAHLICRLEKFRYEAEITLTGKSLRFTAKDEDENWLAAFDKAFGRIQLQLSRLHDRVKNHPKHSRSPKRP